jgi:hypothetical protein
VITDSDPRIPWHARLPLHDQRRWARHRTHLADVEAARWVPIPRHEDARELPIWQTTTARLAYEAALALDAGISAEVRRERRSILLGENW